MEVLKTNKIRTFLVIIIMMMAILLCSTSPAQASITAGKIAASQGANNMGEACDGIATTSGNVLTGDGYIIFSLSDVGITSAKIKLTVCSKKTTTTPLKLDYQLYDSSTKQFYTVASENLTISATKKDYTTTLDLTGAPANLYLKVNGIAGTQVYIYEIGNAD